ncbi:VQ-like protein [Cynara cardunculus var. scolymus]|uniref:VQ-like protein n=2 Tax=Cynara cardunculus var. scolymus TaxID=59895 RepID=A0A124SCS6_CYNCS|nr:VQ-like protein [Cynara cardunculus var. scolymus]
MEDMMINNKPTCSPTTKPFTMHKDSRIISKIKPKIRIIHIFAPEIIKTDVANFRDLVQRLTGKPAEKKKLKTTKRTETQKRSSFSLAAAGAEVTREKIKGEEEIWVGANSGGGFLGGFGDLDGFMQELNHHQNHGFSPVLQNLEAPTLVNSHLDYGFGERSLNLPTYS